MSKEIESSDELMPEAFDMDAIRECLEQYYEAAGFDDFFNRVLAPMSDERALGYFFETFSPEYNTDTSDDAEAWGFEELLASVRRK